MIQTILNRLGNWNPQLFRELKGRLTVRNIAVAASLSIFCQLLLVLFSWVQLPVAPPLGEYINPIYHQYCTGPLNSDRAFTYECLRDHLGSFLINWSRWWQDIFFILSGLLPILLILGGVYMLIGDMAQEERRGTLNFIRLSPQPSATILVGKILGVPTLLYVAIALAFPLHLWSAIQGKIPLTSLLTFEIMLTAICSCFYSASLLYALLGGLQAWLGMILASSVGFPCIQLLQFAIEAGNPSSKQVIDDLLWFYLPIGSSSLGIYSFLLLSMIGLNYGIWQILNRRFRNPASTAFSKLQSYLFVACSQLWLLGFASGELGVNSNYQSQPTVGIACLFWLTPLEFLILIAALSLQRQVLQDWVRYWHPQVSPRQRLWKGALFQDLIMGEKSPGLLAIAVNFAITAIIWIPWMVLMNPSHYWLLEQGKIKVILAWLLTLNLILICAATAQLILFMKTRKPQLWAAATVAAVLALPLSTFVAFSIAPDQNPSLWLFSAIPIFAIPYTSIPRMLLTMLAQWSLLTLLSLQLVRQLRQAGESASKTLLTH